jgi:hypothetical protein
MRIIIGSLEEVYRILKRPPIDENIVPGDEWKLRESKKSKKRIAPFGFQYTPLELQYPLDDLTILFKRFGDNYSCIVPVDSIDKTVFYGVDSRLAEALKSADYQFIPKNPEEKVLKGKIINGSNDCPYAINSANEDFLRIVSLGTGGASTKNLPSKEDDFVREIRGLENMLNLLLNCVLEPFSQRPDIKSLETTPLYLNP